MDGIEALDWGIYCHFDFSGQKTPALLEFMHTAHFLSGYVGSGLLALAAVVLFMVRGRPRSALITVASMVVAVLLIHGTQLLVPRRRPMKAADWLGDAASTPGFPSTNALLFTLALALLGVAIWSFKPRQSLRLLFLLSAIPVWVWVSMSQFVLPLHFFSDVLASFGAAGVIGWSAYLLMESDPAPTTAVAVPPSDAIQDLSHAHGIRQG